jgi:hypothetical protein
MVGWLSISQLMNASLVLVVDSSDSIVLVVFSKAQNIFLTSDMPQFVRFSRSKHAITLL